MTACVSLNEACPFEIVSLEDAVLNAKKYAQLRARFFRRCMIAIIANILFVFFLGATLVSVTFGFILLATILFLSTLELLLAFVTSPRFNSPPYEKFSDSKHPFFISEWTKRLERNGYRRGQIIYYADVTHSHRTQREVNAAVFPPSLFSPTPTLVVSESLITGAHENHIVAMLEHEIAHLRSKIHTLRTIAFVISRPLRAFLLLCAIVRILFERFKCMYVASKLYGIELFLHHVSSQSFQHDFELIADALAVEAMGDMHRYIDALHWISDEKKIDYLWCVHNEHILTHPTLETRIASLCYLCN